MKSRPSLSWLLLLPMILVPCLATGMTQAIGKLGTTVDSKALPSQMLNSAPKDSVRRQPIQSETVQFQYQANSTSNNGTTTVCGSWFFRDLNFTERPARFARVELWRSQVASDVLLDTASVNADGYYEFQPVATNEPAYGYDLFVKLLCQSQQYPIVRVVDSDFDTYWSRTAIHFNVTNGFLNMGTCVEPKQECWAVYDIILDGYFWLLNRTGWSCPEVYAELAQESGSTSGSTYSIGDGMIVWSGDGWENWLRCEVLHEYGHCINFLARGGSFPHSGRQNPVHYLDTVSDDGWAFREGWATFFPCAVDNDPLFTEGYGSLESTTYADTPYGHGTEGDWDGDRVEGAIAQVLWDIFDGIDSNDYPTWDFAYGDYISNGFDQLWSIFLNYGPDSIHDIWVHWFPKDPQIWAIFHHARILEPRNIAISNLLISPMTVVAPGTTIHINITITNLSTVESFNLSVIAGSEDLASYSNIILDGYRSTIFTVELNTTSMVTKIYNLTIQIRNFPSDLNLTDDIRSCTIRITYLPGDINGDFRCDRTDLMILTDAYGSESEGSKWNAEADINVNYSVDLGDLVILALHYGQHYP